MKKILSGLFLVILLSTVAALGSSSDFVRELTQSVLPRVISSLFQTAHESGSTSDKLEDLRRSGLNNESGAVEKKEIPEHVLWRIILAKPKQLKAKAVKSGADPDASTLDFLITKAKLSPEDAQVFRRVSGEYLAEIQPIDDRMQTIAKERKGFRENPKKLSRDHLVATSNEFMELQERHNQIALSYKEQFRNAVSPDSYAAFEQWLTTDFAQSITYFSGGSGAKPESFHVGPGKPRNGFEPIQETENSEVKP